MDDNLRLQWSEKLRLRTMVFHLVGQPWVQRSVFLRNILYKTFFGNRFFPNLGKYRYFGQGQIDRVLARKLAATKKGYFVEIGSNDGLSFSNCKHLELYFGWRGILIEPYEANLELSKAHRSKHNAFVHAALVTKEYKGDSVELIYSNLMTTLVAPSQELPDPAHHAEMGRQFLGPGQEIHKFLAPASTLTRVLQDHKAPKNIDFLSIDIEGHDFEVLRDFDWSYDIEHILVEAMDSENMIRFLASKGFAVEYRDEYNNLFFKKKAPHQIDEL